MCMTLYFDIYLVLLFVLHHLSFVSNEDRFVIVAVLLYESVITPRSNNNSRLTLDKHVQFYCIEIYNKLSRNQ